MMQNNTERKNKNSIIIMSICGLLAYITFFIMYERTIFENSLTKSQIDFMNVYFKLYPIELYKYNLYILPLIISCTILFIYVFNYELELDKQRIRSFLSNKIVLWIFRIIMVIAVIYIINFMSTGNMF